ncbi:exopeptidase, family M19 [Fervidicoccus fontis Kam940]|uniref:Exopeptidase, family M19 n=2 Tax=Fervidicoccus fontis TaxID=683846 RepID=I0A1N4_FERFK|nr:exopeptidase, family M19 [Fervidicoccus fontis Kam940]
MGGKMGNLFESLPIIDHHEDVSSYFLYPGEGGAPYGNFGEDIPGREADIPKYKRGKVRCVFSAIFPGIETFRPEESKELEKIYGKWLPATGYRVPQALLWEHVSIYYKLSDAYKIKIVERVEDVESCIKEERLCFVLHLEGAEALDEPYDLVLLKKIGLRSIGITWNYVNKYGTGCGAKKDTGLSEMGEELVKMANRLGIIVDLAHASKKTSVEAIEISKRPVMISHANVRKLIDRSRNVDDELLELLHKNGGILGFSVIGPLISNRPRPTLDELVDHVMYVYENYGAENIAIGTDFLGLMGLPSPEGLESVDKLPNLLEKLAEKGMNDSDVRKVAYENSLRLMRNNFV